MKTAYLLTLLLLIITCKDAPQSTKSEGTLTDAPTPKDPPNGSALEQNGDYSELFLWDAGNCGFITSAEMAKVLKIPPASIEPETSGCGYKVKENNGNNTRFYFRHEMWNKEQVLGQISDSKENMASLGEDSPLTHIQVSETGDTYLAMNQDRYVMALNENYGGVLVVNYNAVIEQGEKDVAAINKKMAAARNRAYDLANYLLKKYQK